MKIFMRLFTLSVVLASSFGNSSHAEQFNETNVKTNEENSATTKVRFSDLNLDCQLLIMEQLDFKSLRSMALTNRHFLQLANYMFVRKLSKTDIIINGIGINGGKLENPVNLSKKVVQNIYNFWTIPLKFGRDDSIEFRNLQDMANVFTFFGDSITKLTIRCNFDSLNLFRQIIKLVNERCSESLVHLDVYFHLQNNILDLMTVPFKTLQTLTFHNYCNEGGNRALSMDQLFPQLRELSVDLLTTLNRNYIVHHLSRLESLKIIVRSMQSNQLGTNEVEFIKLNPQIKYFELVQHSVTPEILVAAAEYFDSLEMLTLAGFEEPNTKIHFRNVKKFVMRDCYRTPDNIELGNLQELEIACFEHEGLNWIDFIGKHSNLKELHIKQSTVDDSLFMKLTADLTKLEKLSISFLGRQNISTGVLIEFIQEHKELKLFNLKQVWVKEDLQILQESLGHGRTWNIARNRDQFTFNPR